MPKKHPFKDKVATGITSVALFTYGISQAGLQYYDTIKQQVDEQTRGPINSLLWHTGKYIFGFLDDQSENKLAGAKLIRDGALQQPYNVVDTLEDIAQITISGGIAYGVSRLASHQNYIKKLSEKTKTAIAALIGATTYHTLDQLVENTPNNAVEYVTNITQNPLETVVAAGLGALAHKVQKKKKRKKRSKRVYRKLKL